MNENYKSTNSRSLMNTKHNKQNHNHTKAHYAKVTEKSVVKRKILETTRAGKRVKFCTGGRSVKVFVVFSSETMNGRRQWNNIFRRWH